MTLKEDFKVIIHLTSLREVVFNNQETFMSGINEFAATYFMKVKA